MCLSEHCNLSCMYWSLLPLMAFRDGDDTGVSLTMKLKCGVKCPYIMNMGVIMEFSE